MLVPDEEIWSVNEDASAQFGYEFWFLGPRSEDPEFLYDVPFSVKEIALDPLTDRVYLLEQGQRTIHRTGPGARQPLEVFATFSEDRPIGNGAREIEVGSDGQLLVVEHYQTEKGFGARVVRFDDEGQSTLIVDGSRTGALIRSMAYDHRRNALWTFHPDADAFMRIDAEGVVDTFVVDAAAASLIEQGEAFGIQ